MYLISLQNSSEIIRLICDGKKFSGRSPPPCPSFLSNYEGQGGKIMSHKNKIPDFGKIYPQASEEVIKVLYQTERKIHYQEYDLKAGNYKISREEEKVTYIPSREDSIERLLEADYQFTKEQLSVEDEAIRSMMYEKLYKAIEMLEEEERDLLIKFYFKMQSEREIAIQFGLSQKAVNKRKHKILEKLRENINEY